VYLYIYIYIHICSRENKYLVLQQNRVDLALGETCSPATHTYMYMYIYTYTNARIPNIYTSYPNIHLGGALVWSALSQIHRKCFSRTYIAVLSISAALFRFYRAVCTRFARHIRETVLVCSLISVSLFLISRVQFRTYMASNSCIGAYNIYIQPHAFGVSFLHSQFSIHDLVL